MDQHINNSQNEFLWTLLANPANDAHLYAYNLQRLVNDFPQSGILQALLAHASDEKNLKQASVYFNAKSLYKLVNAPSTFIGVSDEKIIIQPGLRTNGHYQRDNRARADEDLSTIRDENIDNNIGEPDFSNHSVIEAIPGIAEHPANIEHPAEHEIVDNKISEPGFAGHSIIEAEPEIVPHTGGHEPVIAHDADQHLNGSLIDEHHSSETAPQIEDSAAPEEPAENKITESYEALSTDNAGQHVPELANTPFTENAETPESEIKNHLEEEAGAATVIDYAETQEELHEKDISDETYDEIVGIENINIEPEAPQSAAAIHEEATSPAEKPSSQAAVNIEEEKLIQGNIAATDFFMFDSAFGGQKQAEPTDNDQPVPSANTTGTDVIKDPLANEADHQDVSKYHDEKMPYTFMWWLDKTRKEHAGTYQPYIKSETVNSNNKPKGVTDALQQQYFENIFHITSIEELDKNTQQTTVPFDMKRKEHIIIERFIKEEPQIKPQSSDKLDNENKAKKSSEDRDELVTETLAGIYSDQMLYHKAIASYKKLMLKFPEKSRYFAGKIEQLEKKTN